MTKKKKRGWGETHHHRGKPFVWDPKLLQPESRFSLHSSFLQPKITLKNEVTRVSEPPGAERDAARGREIIQTRGFSLLSVILYFCRGESWILEFACSPNTRNNKQSWKSTERLCQSSVSRVKKRMHFITANDIFPSGNVALSAPCFIVAWNDLRITCRAQ